jgi:hypothetical protein
VLVLPSGRARQVEKRIALLTGNQAYTPEIGMLANPHKDVALLESLRSWRRAEDLPARIARRFSRSADATDVCCDVALIVRAGTERQLVRELETKKRA